MRAFSPALLLLLLVAFSVTQATKLAAAANPARERQTDAGLPFRTDNGNPNLPWYRLKPGEFPPVGSEHRVGGELVEADYIHRCGVFRREDTGELADFTLPPFGSVAYLNAGADLRDLPLGTCFQFFLYQDDKGNFTQAATMQDEYTLTARQGFIYRLNEIKMSEGRLLVTRHSALKSEAKSELKNGLKSEPEAAPTEIPVNDSTRVWKGDKQVTLNDLMSGDELLFNFTGGRGQTSRRCSDIWDGLDTHKLATEQQRKRHAAFIKARGVPAWIDRVDGDKLTVTLFSSDPTALQTLFKAAGIDPALYAKEHRRISVAVANEHLRTYLPNVTNRGTVVQEFQSVPTDGYGCSGIRWVIQPELMLEGFRKGRVVRLFPPSWPIEAMPFGEGLFAGGHDEEPADSKELQPADFPYRTDFGNENLPWYTLQPGVFPPDHSEHRVGGELVKVDAAHRSGQFRMDRTGELINFTLPPFGSVLYLNADAELEDLPLGMRCLFFLYQDEKGAFTRAGVIEDEYSYLAGNTLTYRLETAQLAEGRLVIARHPAPVQVDYILEPRVAPDFGRIELEVDDKTRVWKGDHQVKLSDLAPGEELLVNLAARTTTSRGRCTDIWAGIETHKLATSQQRKKHAAFLKEHGVPGWIDSVEGSEFTVTLFGSNRKDIAAALGPDPYSKSVRVTLADEQRNSQSGRMDQMQFKTHLPEGDTTATYGCSGIRWTFAAEKLPEGYRKGRILRVYGQ